jgi:hypothetical protein
MAMAMGSAAAGLSVDAQVTLLLAGDGVAPLEALVGQLMSPGNEQRGQAEQLFNHCKANHPDALVVKMVHALQVGDPFALSLSLSLSCLFVLFIEYLLISCVMETTEEENFPFPAS